jgi:uncharacterized protein YbjT (DUF2867 family)
MQAHLATEAHLRELAAANSAFTYTSIREGLYAESTPIYTAFFKPTGASAGVPSEILIPHDGTGPGAAWVARDELGEATARLIAAYAAAEEKGESWEYVNQTVLLTGTKVWSLEETVRVLAEIAGTQVRIRQVSVDEYVKLEQVQAVFQSEEKARTWATAWDAIRAGETAVVTGEMEKILGRKPLEFDVAARKYWSQ